MRHNFSVLSTVPALNQKTLRNNLQHKKRENTWVEAKEGLHAGFIDTQDGTGRSPKKFLPPHPLKCQ